MAREPALCARPEMGRQILVGAMTSGPIVTLLEIDDPSQAHSDEDMGLKPHLSPTKSQSRVRGTPSSPNRQQYVTSFTPGAAELLSPPLPEVKEQYLRMQRDLANEVAVLRSAIELHEMTDAVGQKVKDIVRQGANVSPVVSRQHSPTPSPLGSSAALEAQQQLSNLSSAPSRSPLDKVSTKSMVEVIQKEIEKVDAMQALRIAGQDTEQRYSAEVPVVEDVDAIGPPAQLDDVIERLQALSYSGVGDENSGENILKKSWPCRHCSIWVDLDVRTSTDRKEQCCGGIDATGSCLCCICATDCKEGNDDDQTPWCRHCDTRWSRFRQLEASLRKDFRFDSVEAVDDFLDCTSATRGLVGPPLQHRLDLIMAHTLLQHKLGLIALVTIVRDGGLRCVCSTQQGTKCVMSEQGEVDLSIGANECWAAQEEGVRPVRGSRRTIPSDLRIRRIAGGLKLLDGYITSIDVSGNQRFEELIPMEIVHLKALHCQRCPRLAEKCVPAAIAEQGGEAVVTFLKSIVSNGAKNKMIDLICVGHCQVGKTKMLQALTGGDSEVWDVSAEASGLKFTVQELNEQCLATQWACSRHAIYVLVWRAVKRMCKAGEEQISDMILTWMDFLRFRVPGAQIMLVVTHTDTISEELLRVQIDFAHHIVQIKLHQMQAALEDGSLAPCRVWHGGETLHVGKLDDCQELRSQLIEMAHALPWWCERLPKSFITLREEITAERNLSRKTWLTWDEFVEVARRSQLEGSLLDIATKWLHEVGVIRYFGHAQGRDKPEVDLVDNTVFIDQCWVRDGLTGLFRRVPDGDSLVRFFSTETLPLATSKRWLGRVHRLVMEGIVHEELVDFIWPPGTTPLSKAYWRRAKAAWTGAELCKTMEDHARLLTVLGCCAVLHRYSNAEYQVPLLLADSHSDRLDARAYSAADSRFEKIYILDENPPAFFEILIIQVRRLYALVDYNSWAAAFYRNGCKAQMFLYRDKITERGRPCSVCAVKCITTTAEEQDQILKQIMRVLDFFSGIRFIKIVDFTRAVHEVTTPVQVCIICSPLITASIEYAAQIKQIIAKTDAQYDHEPLCIDAGIGHVETERLRVVLVCIDNWTESSAKVLQQIRAVISQGIAVIPLLCPGYHWPEELPELQAYRYFDCRNMVSDGFKVFLDRERKREEKTSGSTGVLSVEEAFMNLQSEEREELEMTALEERQRWMQSVKPQLTTRIRKYLEDWRGAGTDLVGFKAPDNIPCPDCVHEACASPCWFQRESVGAELNNWIISENKIQHEQQEQGPSPCSVEPSSSCDNGHTIKIEDLLARGTNYESVPCPSCIGAKRLPPFCFSRQQCLEDSSYPDIPLKCPKCEDADPWRRVTLSALEIIPPHVFMSYNEGAEQMMEAQRVMSTQHLVSSLQSQLQQLTGLIVHFEVDRKTVPTRAADAKQPATLQCHQHPALSPCRAVLVFLSDAYCASDVCVREYTSAIREAKCLIPVLVPPHGPVSVGGRPCNPETFVCAIWPF